MSVGHVARLLEEAGIATVVIGVRAFQGRMSAMALPRLVTTPHPMGLSLGAPNDRAGQRTVVLAALNLLETAECGETIVELSGSYHPVWHKHEFHDSV